MGIRRTISVVFPEFEKEKGERGKGKGERKICASRKQPFTFQFSHFSFHVSVFTFHYNMDILYNTFRDFVATMLPDEAEWERMPLAGKRSVEEVLQNLIKDMKDVGGIYNCDLLKLLPKHLMDEYNYPFCDIACFEQQSLAAVKQFFYVDAKRKKPYSEATTNRRKEYIKELHASFSATTGYNPPLVFEKSAAPAVYAIGYLP